MSRIFVCIAILLTTLVPKTNSWPDGIGKEACVNKVPHHWNYPQSSHPPYEILLSKRFYKPNDIIKVTLRGQNGTEFQGLYLVIVSGQNILQNLGTFDLPPDTDKTLCGNQRKNSYLSHNNNNSNQNVITTTWKAPEESFGELLVIATVVQEKTKYWMNVNTTLYTAPLTTDDCGKDIGCLYCEDGCLISWKPDKAKKMIHFNFSLPTESMRSYLALGISPTPGMDGDHVIECVQGDSQHVIRMSYNTGYKNNLVPVPPGVINNPKITYIDGVLKCEFSSPVNSKSTVLPALDQAWYLEYAVGDVKDDGKVLKKQFHSRKAASNSKITFTDISVVDNSTPTLVKLHVFMMVLAWMFFNNLAICIARNYKDLQPDNTIRGAKIWFQLHRLLISFTALFTVIGIIAIFVHVDGYSTFDSKAPGSYTAHPIIGLLIVFLVLTNIFLGILRPDLNSRDRPFFNIIHRSIGMTCQILSIASIFTGAYILNSYLDFIYGMMSFYVGFMLLINIVLFIIDNIYLTDPGRQLDGTSHKMKLLKDVLLPINGVVQLILAVFVASYAVAAN